MWKGSSRAANFVFWLQACQKSLALGLHQVSVDLNRNQRSLFTPTANSMYHRESCDKKSPLIPP